MHALLVLVVLAGCAHQPGAPSSRTQAASVPDARPKLPRAEAKAVVQAELATPTTDPAVLSAGQALADAQCVRCHDMEAPAAYGRGDWEDILPEMVRESRVDAVEARAISAWVLAGAGK